MPFPRKVTSEQRARLRRVALARRHCAQVLRELPTNKQLAAEMGVSRAAIEQILAQERAAHDAAMASAASGCVDAPESSVRP
jgi:transcriptional regulator with XRE-family HTH domain